MRHLFRAVGFLFALAAGYLLAAAVGGVVGISNMREGQPTILLGLASGPIHYDFLLPLSPEVRERFAYVETAGVPIQDPEAEWLIVGWGAEEFYTTVGAYSDISPSAVWKGVTGDASVMRVEAIGPIRRPENIDWILLSEPEFQAFLKAIETGFERDGNGMPERLPVASYPGSAFFKGSGSFHIGRTCNVWVGEVLRAAGIPFGRWTPTPYSVRLSLSRFGLRASPDFQ